MRKIKLFIATTLDGYIATLDDSLDWLMSVEGEGDNGYGEFMADIDTVIMGRTTYDWVMNEMNGDYPYSEQTSYRLFPEGDYASEWQLVKTETFNQFVNVHYVKK